MEKMDLLQIRRFTCQRNCRVSLPGEIPNYVLHNQINSGGREGRSGR